MNAPFFDIHSHSHTNTASSNKIICLLNDGWMHRKIAENIFYSLGVHPQDISLNIDWELFESLIQYKNIKAIGEAGLDKYYPNPIKQEEIFIQLVKYAESCSKPLIIHCVKSYSDILRIRKEYPKTKWVIHGFCGKWQLCRQLLKSNILISFGHRILSPSEGLLETIKNIPLEYAFFETDTCNISISDIYTAFADIRKISVNELKEIILKNVVNTFRLDSDIL